MYKPGLLVPLLCHLVLSFYAIFFCTSFHWTIKSWLQIIIPFFSYVKNLSYSKIFYPICSECLYSYSCLISSQEFDTSTHQVVFHTSYSKPYHPGWSSINFVYKGRKCKHGKHYFGTAAKGFFRTPDDLKVFCWHRTLSYRCFFLDLTISDRSIMWKFLPLLSGVATVRSGNLQLYEALLSAMVSGVGAVDKLCGMAPG